MTGRSPLLSISASALSSALGLLLLAALMAGGCAKPAGTAPTTCGSGFDLCGTDCVDLLSSTKHCGNCGTTCGAGQVCNGGTCGCVSPQVLCGSICTDVQSDAVHCGGCTRPACTTAAPFCSGGQCSATCNAPNTACSSGCVNTQTNPQNCGGCNAPCGNGLSCVAGHCQCPSDQPLCPTTNACATPANCPSGAMGGMTGGLGGQRATGGTTGAVGGMTGTAGMTGGLGGAGGSTRSCPVTDTNIISDFEEGFGVLVKQGGRTGFWYTYADACPTPPANSYTCVGSGASSQTPPPAPATQADHLAVEASGSTDPCNKWAFHSTAANHTAFVGIGAGFSPPAPPSTSMVKSAYSLAAYDGISFTMKSGGGTQPPILFEMLTKENQPDTQGGSIPSPAAGATAAHVATDLYNTRAVLLNKADSSWQPALTTNYQTYYIPFGMLMPRWMPAPGTSKACPPFATGDPKCQAPSWVPADTLGFQLSVLADIPGSSGSYNVWIDDVKLYTRPAGGIPGELPAPPNTAGAAHPFPQNAAMIGANCPKPAGPSVDGRFLVSAYNQWRARFTRAEGGGIRVVRPAAETGTGEDSVSEGIAYGMLIAVYMNDKPFFDGLWAYWRAHCAGTSPGCLMTWRIGGAGGTGTATDADEDAAFAMLMASRQWGATAMPAGDTVSYATNATNLRNTVLAVDTSTSSPFILGGNQYAAGSATNASYFAPAWYRAFAAADTAAGNTTNAARWTALAGQAYTLIGNATAGFASTGLISAWCSNNCMQTATNSGSANANTDVLYQYDSHRIPFRIGIDYCWNGGTAASSYLTKVSSFFAGKAANGVGRVLDIFTPAGGDVGVGTAPTAPNSSSVLGTSAVGALGISADAGYVRDAYQVVFDQSTRASLNDPATGLTPYSYFNASVGLMTLLVMTGNFTLF